MKKIILPLLFCGCALAACQSGGPVMDGYVTDGDYIIANCDDCDNEQIVRYSMPNGNDLVLETERHLIQVEAEPGKAYNYYVWTGEKLYDDDPDLIINNGQAAVLVDE